MRLSRKHAFVLTAVLGMGLGLGAAPSFAVAAPSSSASASTSSSGTSRLILGLKDGAPASLVTALGFTVVEARVDLGLYLVSAPAGIDVTELADLPAVRAACRFVEPDQVVIADQISLAFIDARARVRMQQRDKARSDGGWDTAPRQDAMIRTVKVAILDTGVDFDHPALAGHLALAGHDYVDGDLVPAEAHAPGDGDGDGHDDESYGHGTHAAGLVVGLAPERSVLVLPFRVLDPEGQGRLFDVVQAVHDALASGAGIIQMSLSCESASPALHEAIDSARAHGALVVASAGNAGSRSPRYPAAVPGVLAVAASDADGVLLDTSSFGAHVGVCAEGYGILSTYPGNEYASWSGSSMSASLITGIAARVWSGADQTFAQVRGLAQNIDALNPGKEGELGTGLLSIQNPFSD